VAGALMVSGSDYSAFQANEPLLAFDRQAVDRLVIDGEKGKKVTLAKKNDHWVLPDVANAPVDAAKVKKLLDKVAGLKKGWPVATKADVRKRYAVAKDDYKRKLALYKGDAENALLYVGTSPAYRSVHVRAKGDDDIFNVGLNVYDIGDQSSDWEDKSLLKLKKKDIDKVVFPDVTVLRHDKDFTVDGLADGETVNTDKLNGVITRLTDLSYDAILGAKDKAEKPGKDAFTLTVKMTKGDPTTYTFVKQAKGNDYELTTSSSPYAFKVFKWQVEKLQEATRKVLLKTAKDDKKANAS